MDGPSEHDDPDQALIDGVLARRLRALARAITLVESTRDDHRARAGLLLEALLPHAGRSLRLGISGAPGAGKSTLIEALGLHLVARGRRVAVLAVDPTSTVSGGSILGDKTRMERLARAPGAYIRPSPSGGSPGGVARATREAMLVCEAGGFDPVIVETVGVGQSEAAVAGMVDAFVLLEPPNAGDDLQAIKRGSLELADLVVISKADLDPAAAERAREQFATGLALLRGPASGWRPPVVAVSARDGTGLAEFWAEVERFRAAMAERGDFDARRRSQNVAWMWSLIESALRSRFREHPLVRRDLDPIARAVADGTLTPAAAAARLLAHLDTP